MLLDYYRAPLLFPVVCVKSSFSPCTWNYLIHIQHCFAQKYNWSRKTAECLIFALFSCIEAYNFIAIFNGRIAVIIHLPLLLIISTRAIWKRDGFFLSSRMLFLQPTIHILTSSSSSNYCISRLLFDWTSFRWVRQTISSNRLSWNVRYEKSVLLMKFLI